MSEEESLSAALALLLYGDFIPMGNSQRVDTQQDYWLLDDGIVDKVGATPPPAIFIRSAPIPPEGTLVEIISDEPNNNGLESGGDASKPSIESGLNSHVIDDHPMEREAKELLLLDHKTLFLAPMPPPAPPLPKKEVAIIPTKIEHEEGVFLRSEPFNEDWIIA